MTSLYLDYLIWHPKLHKHPDKILIFQTAVENHGVFMESYLTFIDQIKDAVRQSFYQLRTIKLKPVLQLKDFSWTAATLPQTTLSPSVADDLKCSWSMLNQYNENSTSLSVIFQIDFKILLFVFKVHNISVIYWRSSFKKSFISAFFLCVTEVLAIS